MCFNTWQVARLKLRRSRSFSRGILGHTARARSPSAAQYEWPGVRGESLKILPWGSSEMALHSIGHRFGHLSGRNIMVAFVLSNRGNVSTVPKRVGIQTCRLALELESYSQTDHEVELCWNT